MAGRNFLFVPGPTNVPDRVQRAMMVSMEDHRSIDFPQLTHEILDGLKSVFRTEAGSPLMFPSSGTGAWEAALTNTLSPGDRVLTATFGQFSHLWTDMCRRLNLDVVNIDCDWGTGVPYLEFERILAADPTISAVLVTHNETTTGVTSSVARVRQILDDLNHSALLFVDTVSSLACVEFDFDGWGVDVAVSGSQKGLMTPAGIGLLCVSDKALSAAQTALLPCCYFDLNDMLKSNRTGYFPYTPPLTLMYGLREGIRMLQEEGLDNVVARHHRLAEGVRRAVTQGWGLELCAQAPEWYSDTVSAVMLPEPVNGADVIGRAYKRYNLSLGAGLNKLAGRLFRIGHMGDMNEIHLMAAIAGAEMAMQDCGVNIKSGSGVAAASDYWRAQ